MSDEETTNEETETETETETTTETEQETASTLTDWRDSIEDTGLKNAAERFASPSDVVKAVVDLRKRESNAVRLIGKKSTEEEISTYRKAMDIPPVSKDYEMPRPEHMDDEMFKSEAVQERLGKFAEMAHGHFLSKAQASAVLEMYWTMEAEGAEAVVEADKAYAKETEAALETKWGKDYETNKMIGDRAAKSLFGDTYDEVARLEDKNGRYILDNPVMIEALVRVGREMEEGKLGGGMNEEQRDTVAEQITDLRKQSADAASAGDHRKADKLYQKEQALIAKRDGVEPIVGDMGRVA